MFIYLLNVGICQILHNDIHVWFVGRAGPRLLSSTICSEKHVCNGMIHKSVGRIHRFYTVSFAPRMKLEESMSMRISYSRDREIEPCNTNQTSFHMQYQHEERPKRLHIEVALKKQYWWAYWFLILTQTKRLHCLLESWRVTPCFLFSCLIGVRELYEAPRTQRTDGVGRLCSLRHHR